PMSAAEIEERNRKNRERAAKEEQEQAKKQAAASRRAKWVFEERTQKVNPQHPYLVKKGISDPAVLQHIRQSGNNLIIPLKQGKKVVGIQMIFPNGRKHIPADIPKRGSALFLGDTRLENLKQGFFVAEGFATAASIVQATGRPCLMTIDAGNMPTVVHSLKNVVQKHHIPVVLCADNDEDHKGEKKAKEAAEILGDTAQVIMPYFTAEEIARFQANDPDKLPSDFNDLQTLRGIDSVTEMLSGSLTAVANPENKLLINVYGSPATGKSYTAEHLAAVLRDAGIECELVTEYATELIHQGRTDELKDQVFVTGEQLRREQAALNHANIVITDSPTALGIIYAPEHQKAALHDIAAQSDKIPHINIFLRHDYESLATFSMNGRIHDKEQSLAIQEQLIELLKGKERIHHQRAIPFEELINHIGTNKEWQRFAEHHNINLPRFDIAMDGTVMNRDDNLSGSLNVAENDTLVIEKTAESITMNNEMPKPERSAWGDFPPAITNADLGDLKNDPDYSAAKAGDIERARNLVNRLLKEETIEQMIAQFQPRINTTILLPVLAEETVGKNKIPLAVAEMVSKQTGLPYTTSIFQTNHIGRTNKNADSRLLFQATFGGTVEKNKDYILIDDTLTMGGTVAALRSFVIQNGGRVSGVMVMTAQQRSLQLAPSAELLDNIRLKHGENIENFLQKELGYGLTELTNAEASHIYAYANADTVRTRFAQTRYVESGGMVEETTAPQKSEDLQIAKLTVSLRETHHPKAIIKTEPPTSLCKGEVVHIGDDFVVQRVEDNSRYFQKWNRQDLNIPLQVGDKARIYVDKNGKVQVKVTATDKDKSLSPDNEKPRPPQGGFALPVENQSDENR
ncbi:MAG: toprim domain-containing protein, partial [Neisseriaceae bacterium]|nr:toprim domain-containing protein [Neisseriaceae bacterium]